MSKQNAQVIGYGGGETLAGILTRNDIISKCDNGLTAILQQSLSNNQPIYFMPNDVSDATEYVSTYILRIYGTLINGQKARVDITGIKPFFDVIVPDGKPLAIFKSNLVKIVSKTLKGTSKFGTKIINAFPLRGYHTEKKPYIRVITWNQYDRYDALKAVCESGIKTASDDLNKQYYFQKIAREKRSPLSSSAILHDYIYNKNIFRVSVDNYNAINENEYMLETLGFAHKNPLITSALSRDKTLVLTWDIETYSSRKMGDLPNAKNEEDRVFMTPIH